MPKLSARTVLEKILPELLAERQAHMDALAQLDAMFSGFGINFATAKGPGRKPGKAGRKAAKAQGRGRGRFDQTAEAFVLGMLKGGSLTTKQINAKWEASGRGGRAGNTLMKLVDAKAVKRAKINGGQGSTYSVA